MKVKKYQEPDGPVEQIVPVVPLTNLSRSQIKRNAIGNARDEDFADDYINSRISVGGNRRWQKRYHDRHFNRERNRIAKEKERSEIERQVAEMMSNNDWFYRSIGGGKPEHPASVHGRQYVQPLVDAAVWGIGGAMGAANPITTTLAPELLGGAGHATKVMMNPASAKTMAGAFLGTAADSYLVTQGLYQNSALLDKWWNGNFDWQDIPQFGLNTLSVFPYANAATKGVNYISKAYNDIKALPKTISSAINSGKKTFGKKAFGMVDDINRYIDEGSYFRTVDRPAIDDALSTGVIRAKTGLHHDAVDYLKNNFQQYLDDIPGWEKMDANDLRTLLDEKGAFNIGGDDLRKQAWLEIRNSTNHGGSVHYFKGTTYPNYRVSQHNYVIETPETAGTFVPGHGGKEFVDWRGPVGSALLKTNGSVQNASIPAKGSMYWEYSPFWEMWKRTKFKIGGKIKYE